MTVIMMMPGMTLHDHGGLPHRKFQSERQKADYLKNIFANVYLKDVIERNKIQNVDEIDSG